MKPAAGVFMADWIFRNLAPGRNNEALAGDLMEEFHGGRSAFWYWRQVFSALWIAHVREIFSQRMVIVFAAFWAGLSPAWVLAVTDLERHFHLSQRMQSMEWPWPILSSFGFLLGANLIFIWTGILLPLISHACMAKSFRPRLLVRGVSASLPILFVIWIALLILPLRFLKSHTVPEQSHAFSSSASFRPHESVAYSNPCTAIVDTGSKAMLLRLPFFLCVLYALWGATRWSENRKFAQLSSDREMRL